MYFDTMYHMVKIFDWFAVRINRNNRSLSDPRVDPKQLAGLGLFQRWSRKQTAGARVLTPLEGWLL